MPLLLALVLSQSPQLVVLLKEVQPAKGGTLRCSLYTAEAGFPMDTSKAAATTQAPRRADGTYRCEFDLPRGGTYAVAAAHDANDNGKVDTGMFSIPTEGWGTSNDVRPALRPPTFAESKVMVPDAGSQISITMRY